MCLIITVAVAIVFSVLFFVSKKTGGAEKSHGYGIRKFSQPLFTTMLAFWAAAIMWSVDGIANVAGGEPFLDLSKEDALLGVIVALCGIVLFAVLALRNKKISRKQSKNC
ncbi:hypothetical protein [uncultured Treponema sp.]|uniref:hypothetical protein n=1 Tax=uncultured Treponema sp. TaxID=162155 RepID=UPI0025EA6239|nr:hypothetical protein [uncultured Treponema sp.]